MVVEIILILIVAFALRIIFMLGNTCDQDVHLHYMNDVKKFGLRHPDLYDSLVQGYNGYPSLPHYIVTRFPKKIWVPVGRFLNIFYDLLTIIVVYIIAFLLLDSSKYSSANLLFSPQGWTALLYAISPIMFPITARLKAMGGRTIGPLLVTAYFSFIITAMVSGKVLWVFLAIPFGILTVTASIFGTQVIVLFSLFLSILLMQWLPVVTVLLTFGIGLVIPCLDIKRILVSEWYQYQWYYKSIDFNSPIANRNKLKNYLSLFQDLRKDPVKVAQTIFENTSWFIAVYSFPVLFVLLWWKINGKYVPGLLPFTYIPFLWAIIFSSLLAFFITSFRPFIIFGQAERYLEYSAPIGYLLFVSAALQLGSEKLLFAFVLISIATIMLNYILVMGVDFLVKIYSKPDMFLVECVQKLGKINCPRILTIPSVLANLTSAHLDSDKACFHYDFVSEFKRGYQYMIEDRVIFQYAKPDFEYYIKKYDINTVVIRKRYLEKAVKLGIQYSFENYQKLFENEEYVIYSLIPTSPS